MPCRSDYDDCWYAGEYVPDIIKNLDLVTRVACEMGKLLKQHTLIADLPDEARFWITDHFKKDEERKAREEAQARKEAAMLSGMAKLTDEEKEALGLDGGKGKLR